MDIKIFYFSSFLKVFNFKKGNIFVNNAFLNVKVFQNEEKFKKEKYAHEK